MGRHAAPAAPHEVDSLAHPVPVITFAGQATPDERGLAFVHRSGLGHVVIATSRRRALAPHDSIGLTQGERYGLAIATELIVLGRPSGWGRDTLELIRLAEVGMKVISAWNLDASETLGELVARVRADRTARRTA